MRMENICKNYFHGFQDLARWRENGAKTNLLSIVKIVSYCFIVPPIAVGITWGASTLMGRVTQLIKGNDFASIKILADRGNSDACYKLACMYQKGDGNVKKDSLQAYSYFKEAAYNGHPQALYSLGQIERKEGNSEKAFEYITKSAKLGFAEAQASLAAMYEEGIDVPKDDQKALHWYEKAAEQGNATALKVLGWKHCTGSGVIQSYTLAFKYFSEAAKKGNPEAQYYLGKMYEKGFGCDRDLFNTIQLYKEAAKQGNKNALQALNRLSIPL